jgi:hypothetical protein
MVLIYKRKDSEMFEFFKRIFSRKYVKHTFWKGGIDDLELKSILDLCSIGDFEIVSYTIRHVMCGYKIIVYTKKKEK